MLQDFWSNAMWKEELVNRYPFLCQRYKGDMRETCMAWGFDINDGWKELLGLLLEELEQHNKKVNIDKRVVLEQVKQKLGYLTVYIDSVYSDEYVTDHCKAAREIVEQYMVKSATVCEFCGKPGERISGRWIFTLCKECAIDRQNKREQKLDEV